MPRGKQRRQKDDSGSVLRKAASAFWRILLVLVAIRVLMLQSPLLNNTFLKETSKLILSNEAAARVVPSGLLVPLESVAEPDRRFQPGPYPYGNNDTLFLTGAALRGDYHELEALWFQFYALGERPFLVYLPCEFEAGSPFEGRNASQYTGGLPFKRVAEMEQEKFRCQINDRTAKCELIPTNRGADANTNDLLQVWRCPLHGIDGEDALVSPKDLEYFRQASAGTSLVLPIDIVHENTANVFTKVTTLHLPIFEPSVGIHTIRSKPRSPVIPPFLSRRYNITLCLVAEPNGLAHLTEHMRYHLDVLGIDHIHLALDAGLERMGNENATRLVRTANRMLRPEIDRGKVTVSTMWDDSLGLYCKETDIPKSIFYQDCLYRAKSTSEFVATWDLDEFLVLKNSNNLQKNLADVIRQIHHPVCEGWSFVTVESAVAGRKSPLDNTGLVAYDYSIREKKTEQTWQKSISRTKNVFVNSFHIPGSCLLPGTSSMSDLQSIHPNDGKCAFYINDEAMVIHARGVHHGFTEDINDPVPNELQARLTSDLE